MNLVASQSAVWDDDAVSQALACAAFWVKDLPFVKSLSGYWKFLLASSPASVPSNFYDISFQDSTWDKIPGSYSFSSSSNCIIFLSPRNGHFHLLVVQSVFLLLILNDAMFLTFLYSKSNRK